MLKNTVIFIATLAALIILTLIVKFVFPNIFIEKFEKKKFNKAMREQVRIVDHESIKLNLLDPEMSPPSIHDKVMYGYNLILYTNKALPDYVDDRLTCANCHFAGGNTLGGKRGGISLVGVVRSYPRYEERFGRTIDLVDRINNCFERSMNGKPLERNSEEMQAILAYLSWIASEIPQRTNYPWLGLQPLKTSHKANSRNGEKFYDQFCASCHQNDGQGTENNPPLWGPHAYNDGAGMSMLPKLASFVYYNMPLDDPFLTEEEALDISAFLIEQRRPNYVPNGLKN